MPCICYGATSGIEDYDTFLKSLEGKEVMEHLHKAANLIKSHKLHPEVIDMSTIEFRQMFVKCLLNILVGCDEKGRPSEND